MANTVQEKVQKCFESRLKDETELTKVQSDIAGAVDYSERRARVVRLVESCEAALTKTFTKNEKLLELAKSNDSTMTTVYLEKWLGDVTAENDAIMKKARDYIDQCPDQDKVSQISRQTTTVKIKSSKGTGSKYSKTSTQRQQRCEEIARQNKATLRLAKQKQQLELEQQELEVQKLRKEQALRVEKLEEEMRRKLGRTHLS